MLDKDPDLYKDIWIYAEHSGNKIVNVCFELLGEASSLAAKLDCSVCAVLIGNDVRPLVDELFKWGADKVYIFENENLEIFNLEAYAKVISKAIIKHKPEIFLIGSTIEGRAIAPKIAGRFGLGLIAEGAGFNIGENRNLVVDRYSFGGLVLSKVVTVDTRPQMVTVRAGMMRALEKDESRTGEIIPITAEIGGDDLLTKLIGVAKAPKKYVGLTEAEIVVSGGRGVGGSEGFELIQKLADKLNGVVGASRVAVDMGWVGYEHQVGQAGSTVKPRIYIAAGISGASQHLVGMWQSEIVIAINTHPYAAIFEFADYGIVGDLFEVIPKLIEELDK